MVVQRSAELSDEQLMARLGGPELMQLSPHSTIATAAQSTEWA